MIRLDLTLSLTWSLPEGHCGVVEVLVAARADLRSRERSGQTALMLAADGGNAAIVTTLVEVRPSPFTALCG